MTPRIPHAIAKELCNIVDISILMNMLAFNPNFRAMSNKVMTSSEFPYFTILLKFYKNNEAVVRLGRKEAGDSEGIKTGEELHQD